jgi:hypothetical protein
MMSWFSFGMFSFAFALLLPAVYLVARQARRFFAWADRDQEKAPKERVGVYLTLAVIIGFILGSMVQNLWNQAAPCRAQGKPVATCLFSV